MTDYYSHRLDIMGTNTDKIGLDITLASGINVETMLQLNVSIIIYIMAGENLLNEWAEIIFCLLKFVQTM